MARSSITQSAITLGVIGSMAGNITWAWTRSPVLVGVGVAMSLVLPTAVRLWRASSGATGWARAERAAVMAFICGGAALYTLIHTGSLLHELGLPGVIAWLPGAVMEALVVQAVRAGAPVGRGRTASATARRSAPLTPPCAPAAVPAAEEAPEDRRRRLAAQRQRRARDRKRQEAAA